MSDYSIPAELPPILKELAREVLRQQPDDVVQFCADYFHRLLAQQRRTLIDHADDATKSQLAVTAVRIPGGAGASSSGVSDPAYASSTDDGFGSELDEDEEEDADEFDDAPVIPPPVINRGRRTSVSAESMAPTAHDAPAEKVLIPKTPEQRARIQASIATNFLFRNLDEDQYTDVVDAMAEKKVAAGEAVIRQGGVGDYFYIVETGTLDVYVARNGVEAKVFDYGPGGSFGELALMYNAPRAATVTATSDAVLWALDRVTFRRILMDHTSRKRRMYEAFLEEVPLLSSLEPYERHKIADALESVTFEDGETVIKQGDIGDNFYLIEAGDAEVVKVDENGVEHQMRPLRKGNYFGELALLSDKPRVATIKAKGKLKCATLGKKAFTRLLGPLAEIMQRNTQNYERYPGEK
ncbi:cAMP-dependent protein kinase regulatory subunit [Allomyces macrogynus ATCC 38327]|uniref:cAMP-dependent protein kinase regulatory subunit n=1 Tax=Allomyces macrogynus (strain ATCC 38327) TaxID=578462 RepID=A0A0L0SSL3_ALLM3|nr:cAMP-dependent protein kinase regulatory subunit [Allomyces macrogynus ATCC 38327]|eukprot:KNE65375.1 cAMP-dependent protein kinase regulatory subunit [Allomyces macrogynus ATCC 38327]